ncbi:Uncharacterised protein [Alistipes sp. cv1]|nr:Uncharacterised protein [Faecalibacterium prausnitzii]
MAFDGETGIAKRLCLKLLPAKSENRPGGMPPKTNHFVRH